MTGIDIEREAVPTDDELEEMVYGPKSAPFVSEAQHLLVVGSVNVDDFIPRLPDIYYYLGDEDKITVEPDEKPFTKAAEAILENYDASRKFIEFQKTEKSGGPGFLTLSFVVRRLRELRDAHKTQRIGGSATNVATTLHEFARERTSDSDADTLKVIARGGTQKKRSLLAKMFKDRDIDITLQESLINSHSIILPFIRSDGKPGRRVFVQRAPTPEIDEKIIEQRNSAVVGKLPDGRWANRLGGDENIKTMMWLPGDSITDSPEVLDNMLRNGSRTVIFNREEALKAMGKDLKDPIETGDISSHFTSKYNGIHFVVTDAGNGPYYSYKKDDKTETVKYHHPPKEFIPPDEEHNNLGAGDAFSSAYFKAINIGFTIQESLQLADEAAQIVMSHIRAAMPEDTDLSTSDMFRESS